MYSLGLRDLLIILIPMAAVVVLWVNAFLIMRKDAREGLAPVQPLWILIILFFPIAGSIIYFTLGRIAVKEKRRFNPDFSKVRK